MLPVTGCLRRLQIRFRPVVQDGTRNIACRESFYSGQEVRFADITTDLLEPRLGPTSELRTIHLEHSVGRARTLINLMR